VSVKEDGDPTVWVLQTEPAVLRNFLMPSAFCLENEGFDNRNSVFLINPDNRQPINTLEYESDISDILINPTGSSRCLLDGIAGSNSTWGHGSLSLISVVRRQVEVRASGLSLTPPNHASMSQRRRPQSGTAAWSCYDNDRQSQC